MLSSIEYQDALWHKQRVILYLKDSIAAQNFDCAAIASVLLLIWTEMYESNNRTWKFHFDGMGEMIRQLLLNGHVRSPIERYLQEIYLVYVIIFPLNFLM